MKTLKELEINENKISKGYLKDGKLYRNVNGKEIKQIEEKTIEDVEKNRLINLWRMR